MPVEELTKKEQIINFAQNDPFLKISDIAEYVQTTPRYVRTILSEANISLMKLREKYARSMEKRLQVQDAPIDAQNAVRFRPIQGGLKAGEIQIQLIFEEEYEELQKINKDEKLWRINQICYSAEKPFCVKEIITFFPEDLTNEKVESMESVYELFGRKGINRLLFQDNIVRFDPPNEEVRKLLNVKKMELVMIISRYILLNKIPIGMENYYLRTDKVEISFAGEFLM
jgi:hypothetical protein